MKTNKQIIKRMAMLVEKKMEKFKSGFYDYDKVTIENADVETLVALWIVGRCNTDLLMLSDYKKSFNENEAVRYKYAAGGDPFSSYFSPCLYCSDYVTYLITKDGLLLVTPEQALEIIRDTVTPVVERWIRENGELPKNTRLNLKIGGITLSELKEMIRSDKSEIGHRLIDKLRHVRNYGRVSKDQFIQVWYNKSWNEFSYTEYLNGKPIFSGGIVYHGSPEEGYMQNNSVQLEPSYGWSIHS